ncbi:MAG: hypothetical protein EON58_14030 [Alphaproteobacteria bacterium]|nr:MAG: hypothetical protein EON58_14030 [Alphaproteobacteria bacterium]
MDYVCPITKQKFEDFWEHTLTDYTFHFMWCCNAIQWAIQQYDASKVSPSPQTREVGLPVTRRDTILARVRVDDRR